MGFALARRSRASPSSVPRQAPCGVGCLQRPSHEHARPTPRLRVRPFPATTNPASTMASADFSTASTGLSTSAVPPPGDHTLVTEHHGTPMEISPGKTSNLHHAPAAYTSRSLDDIGLRHLQLARPDRAASNAIRVPRVAVSSSGFLPTPPHDDAVAFDLWLVPSTPTGDSHPQAAGHAERTATAPGSQRCAGANYGYRRDVITPRRRDTTGRAARRRPLG
jgi:hypothetical protein